jgi:hydroxymethylpyrimidine pyrophosphatase-like HAD family hydrolase
MAPTPVRLVACDLDGTLFGPGGRPTPRTLAALAAADAAGVAVVPATGRSHYTALPRLAGAAGLRWLVCSNGAILYDRVEDRIVDRHPVGADALPALVAAVRAGLPGAGFGWEGLDGFGYETGFLDMGPPADVTAGEVLDALGPPWPAVTKLFVGHRDVVREDLLALVTPLMVDGLVVTCSGAGFVEVTGAGVDKAFGVARVCERLGIDRGEVLAIGDHLNDVALLRWAGRSVAMADGHPAALAAAAEVTPGCAEDGAALVLERVLAPAHP